MATSRTNSDAVVQVDLEATVRRSSRNVLTPTRFQYSAEIATDIKKKRTTPTTHNDKKRQNSRKDIKEEDDVKNSAVECTSGGHAGLSSYELERLENIKQNQAFLSSINLFQATEELKQVTRPKLSKRRLMRLQAAVEKGVPVRKSLRLQSLTLPPKPRETQICGLSHKRPPGPLLMKPVNMEDEAKLPSQLLELFSEVSTEDRKELSLTEYCSALKNMKTTEDREVIVVNKRLVCAAFHPCTSSLLMATGNTFGSVGLWQLGSDWGNDGVLRFEPHTRVVTCIAFSRAHPTHLLSLSHDGTVRCMDVEKAVFDDVYESEEHLKTFDFMSHDCTSLVVGYFNGKVAIVDRRTPGNSHESIHSLKFKHCLLCVSVHPLQKQYFAVTENKRVNIYDSRYLKEKKSKTVSQLHGHSLSIHGAYFSPRTGNRVLTSCMDDYIRHKLQTASYRTRVSAVWDPKQEDCFVVGSTSKRHIVKVFHESGKLLHSFVDRDNVTSVLYVTAFHPTRNALLGGNASGQLHVFSD
ncbi:WD repeat-containing protein 76 isoform X3 [Perca flavescens]|uniref:WD repeat-containing protein 76 isoform X3 n=1 Tax=Perca flavescens TaxID=8167 RepID=UPI00106ED0C3|nr:WD repeat-containing protein 76 isoform X3 [Perca flavescens]